MERHTRSYRGISKRAAIGYLERIDGTQVTPDTVEGNGWRASLAADTVGIGPTLELTEVTITFEGDGETLDDLIETFSQKAMRAGG
jgi:hypothetical protein